MNNPRADFFFVHAILLHHWRPLRFKLSESSPGTSVSVRFVFHLIQDYRRNGDAV